MDVDDKLVFQAGRTIEDGAKAAAQMLGEASDATAVQAVNDLVAVGCAETFLNHGLRIPQDMSVAGFGNILLGEYFRVPLTTIRQPKFRLGAAAVELMQQLLAGQRPESKRLPAELIVRASTAAPPPPESSAKPSNSATRQGAHSVRAAARRGPRALPARRRTPGSC